MLTDDELADEIEEAISDSIDMDWQPKWAVPAILKLIHQAREEGCRAGIEAAKRVLHDCGEPCPVCSEQIDALDPVQIVEAMRYD